MGFDATNTQAWHRHSRAATVIVAVVAITTAALGIFLSVATSYR